MINTTDIRATVQAIAGLAVHPTDSERVVKLMEEVGEVAQVLNDYVLDEVTRSEARARLREELVQVGAVAAGLVVGLDLME